MDHPRRRRAWILAPAVLLLAGLISPAAVAAATDSDHDRLPNTWERTYSLTSPYRADTDRDGILDGREDPDHDGLTNRQEYLAGMNPRRADTDRDGIRDDREDTDRDGLRTKFEFLAGTSPRRADSDRDGQHDGAENPDRDGLSNATEQRLRTNPRVADTDGDGWSDGAEIRAGTDPRKSTSHPPKPTPTPSPTPTPAQIPCGSSLQDRVNATPTGALLDLTGCSYTIASNNVAISRSMTIRGGTMRASASGLLILASNVTVSGMRLMGPGYDAQRNHFGISVRGASATSYVSNITLFDNSVSGWDGQGIDASFVDGFTFSNNVISNIWYAGIGGTSVKNGHITGNHVFNIVGTPNAYGIYLSRGYGSLAANPRSSDVEVSDNTIEDVPNWDGLNTHAGQRIQFLANIVRRCRYAIFIAGAYDTSGGTETFAPLDVTVSGNTLASGVTDGSRGTGIWFSGAGSGLGSSTELATGVISANAITGYGDQSNGADGAIRVRDTSGLQITNNRIAEGGPTGIEFYNNNYGFAASGNTITDPWSNAVPRAIGIYVNSDYNSGAISSNTFLRGTKSALYVLTATVSVQTMPHVGVTVR